MTHDSAKDKVQNYQKYFIASTNLIHDKSWQKVVSSFCFNIFLCLFIYSTRAGHPWAVCWCHNSPRPLCLLSKFMFYFDLNFKIIPSNYGCPACIVLAGACLIVLINPAWGDQAEMILLPGLWLSDELILAFCRPAPIWGGLLLPASARGMQSVEVIIHCWYLSVWWRGGGPCRDMRLSSVTQTHNMSLFSCCSLPMWHDILVAEVF